MSTKTSQKPKTAIISKTNYNSNTHRGPTAQNNVKDIVKQVQTIYSKFEKGEVDHRRLTKVVVEDLKAGSGRFENIIKSAKEDKKDFKNIMKSLDIFHRPTCHPGFSTEEIKTSTEKKFPRYIRHKASNSIVTPMHTGSNFLSHPDSNVNSKMSSRKNLKETVDKFARGYIDTQQFEEELKQKNVNPNMEEIKKHIRTASMGSINYKDLMVCVMKYKEDQYGNEPDKWKHKSRQLNNFDHGGFEDEGNTFRSLMGRNGQDPLVLKKRKTIHNDPNFCSKREIFEWDTERDGLAPTNREIYVKERGSVRDKFIHKGRVMIHENDPDKLYTHKRKISGLLGNGNILEWNETDIIKKRRTHSFDFENQKPNIFRRKDPNYTVPVNPEEQRKPKPSVKKVNALLYESNNNPFKFK